MQSISWPPSYATLLNNKRQTQFIFLNLQQHFVNTMIIQGPQLILGYLQGATVRLLNGKYQKIKNQKQWQILFIKMRKFKRKGNRDNDQQQTPTRKLKTEYDERSQSSQSTTKNISFDQMSLSGKQLSFNNGSSGAYFLFSALSRQLQKKLFLALQKIKCKSETQKRKVCESARISLGGSRILQRLKIDAFNKIKQEKQRNCLKKEGIFMIQQCTLGIDQRIKYQSLITLLNTVNSSIREENKSLRQVGTKYRQNQIPEQYIRSFYKFIKINPKNYKAFTKSSEQVIQPSIEPILALLQAKKSSKNNQTNSQVLMMIIKNYVISYKDAAVRINISQNQTKTVQKEKQEIAGQFKNYQKEVQHSFKELSKFDNDLVCKVDEMVATQFNPTAIKCAQRAIQYQLKICENKKQHSYIYQSRILTLKSLQSVLSRLVNNAQPVKQNLSSSRLKSKSTMNTSRSQIIRQKNAIQQCDALEQIENITKSMLGVLTRDYSLETVTKYINQNIQRQKIDILPQVGGIRHNFTKIAQYHKDLLVKYQEKMNSIQVEQMRKKVEQVQDKIEQMTRKLSLLDQNKIDQIDKIARQFEKKRQKYQATIISLEKKIEQVETDLESKNKKIQSMNKKKDKKLDLINQQYRDITKIVNKIDEDKKERNKSIQDIVERSLSKSRSKLFASGQITPIQRLTPQSSTNKLLQNSQLSIPLSVIQGSSLINSYQKKNLPSKLEKQLSKNNLKELGKVRQPKISIFDDDQDQIQFELQQEKKANILKTQRLGINEPKKSLIYHTPKKQGKPIPVPVKTAKHSNNIGK